MSIKKIVLSGAALLALVAQTAQASIIDSPFFQVLGVVVVWGGAAGDTEGAPPIVSDFVLLTPASGTAGADIIAGDVQAVVTTGTLDPIIDNPTSGGVLTDDGDGVLDADDSLTAFGLDATTDVSGLVEDHESSFFVASNTAFDIHAISTAATTTGDFSSLDETDITFDLSVTTSGTHTYTGGALAFGANAQDPSVGADAPVTGINDLGDLLTETKVFDGGQRTAASTGALASQSVRFDATYGLDGGYDLSLGTGSITADVTYTIFVP